MIKSIIFILMKKSNIPVLLLVLLTLATGCKEQTASQMPPANVQVVQVIQQDIPLVEEFVGQTYGLFDISIQARVDGFLEGIYFEEGKRVKKGQLLYTIAPEPYEAKLATTQGKLAEANTMLVKAQSDLNRIEPLAKKNAVSQSDLDAAVAQRDAAMASVEAAEATVESARIELGFTKIYSPIDGIIGKTEVYPGDYVGRGFTNVVLNEVSRIDTILVNFHLPEEKYIEVARYLSQRTGQRAETRAETESSINMILADGTLYPYEGKLRFINRQVNATTGTILVQASFPNTEDFLRPGQFAKVRTVIDVIKGGLLVPQRCVQEMQGNYSVIVVNDSDEVEFRSIEVATEYQTSFMVVSSGLEPGERVVYEGIQKVKSGARVNPVLKEITISELEN
jgi:membrane fusion protein (multidrug efflux system)